jgi:hypothetical protein
MIRKPSVWEAYLFLSKNRYRKKSSLIKKALKLFIDMTTVVYLLLFFGYIFAALFIFGDIMAELAPYFEWLEANANAGFWILLTALPVIYVIKSFSEPGIQFSSSEFQLSLLPYARGKVWMVVLIVKLVKSALIYSLTSGILAIVTPIPAGIIFSYWALFIAYEVIMTVPQWKLFQQKLWVKVIMLLTMIGINILGMTVGTAVVGLVMTGLIILSHIYLLPVLFKRINWSRVTEISDYQIWNMQLLRYASNTKMKRPKKFGIFQNNPRRKTPFQTNQAIYHRMWKVYLFRNLDLLFKLIGALFLMLIVLPFIHEIALAIGLAIAIYAYSSVMSTFFFDRFQSDLLQALPWNLAGYRRSFFVWTIAGGIILFIPAMIGVYIFAGYWVFLYMMLVITVFLYSFSLKTNKSMVALAKKAKIFQLENGIHFISLLLVGCSVLYPLLTLAFPLIFILAKKQMELDGEEFVQV